MMLPLAQTLPPAQDLAAFFGVAAFLLIIYNQAKSAFGINPPLHKSYASKDELHEVHGRIKRERAEINQAMAKIEAAALASNCRLDDELSAIREQIVDNNRAGEARMETLRTQIADQTKLIISVIRREGGGL